MRKLTLIIVISGLISSCSRTSNSYTIRLEMDGIEGRWVKLFESVDQEYVVVDSVLADSGSVAVLSKSVDGVRIRFLAVEGGPGSIRLLVENAEYDISGSFEEPVIETNSDAQRDLNDYNERTRVFSEAQSALIDAYYEAAEKEENDVMDSILAEYEKNSAQQMAFDSAFVKDNPASFASVLVLRGSFYAMDVEELEETLNSLDPSLHQLEEYKYMYGIMERQKEVAVGKHYRDFGLATPEGETLRVSDVHGGNNVLLIDFWASWCGPCRRANPELVKLYNEFHEQGFEILGVSLDNDTASWIGAIEEDGLIWRQISDIRGWECEGARIYGVPAIPHSVLVDREGIISAKELYGDDLREAVRKLL